MQFLFFTGNFDKLEKLHLNHVNSIQDIEMDNALFVFKGKNSKSLLLVDTLIVENAYSPCTIGSMNKFGVHYVER